MIRSDTINPRSNEGIVMLFCNRAYRGGAHHGNVRCQLDARGHGRFWSYGTVIAIRGPTGVVLSSRRYSSTTSRH